MADIDYLKNPLIIGAAAAALTYCYLYWKESKKRKKNPKVKPRSVNVITPAFVGVIAWFIAGSCFDEATPSNTTEVSGNIQGSTTGMSGGTTGVTQFKPTNIGSIADVLNKATVSQVNPQATTVPVNATNGESFHVIKKNSIRLPPTDVFIDLADF